MISQDKLAEERKACLFAELTIGISSEPVTPEQEAEISRIVDQQLSARLASCEQGSLKERVMRGIDKLKDGAE